MVVVAFDIGDLVDWIMYKFDYNEDIAIVISEYVEEYNQDTGNWIDIYSWIENEFSFNCNIFDNESQAYDYLNDEYDGSSVLEYNDYRVFVASNDLVLLEVYQ